MPKLPNGPTQGPIHSVPCPWCHQGQDFRPLADGEEMGGAGWGSQGLEPGATVICDHCDRPSRIISATKTVIVRLSPS